MKVTLLDTVTGDQTVSEGIPLKQWTDGNWSCDCNRELAFDNDSEDVHGDFVCKSERYLVIATEPEYDLYEMNSGYPTDLLAKHGLPTSREEYGHVTVENGIMRIHYPKDEA